MKLGKVLFRLVLLFLIIAAGYYFIPEKTLPAGTKIDSLVVKKAERKLIVYSKGREIKTYRISLGRNPIGDKEFEGDKKTPEGLYFICAKNANSGYHKNLGISYPNTEDITNSIKLGKPTGGDVKIHGLRNGLGFLGKFHRLFDWTAGCIALTDEEVDELYAAVEIGSRIEIKP